MHRFVASVLLLAVAAASAASPASFNGDHLRVTLVAEHDALVPGHSTWLGLRLQHAPHWHTYWINPGDSGLPTRLSWNLPPGYAAGEIAWPVPQRESVGGLVNFGYEGDVLLPVPLEVPAQGAGTSAHLEVQAKWLVCEESCVPGKATLALDLPVRTTATANADAAALFAAARAAQPQSGDWDASAQLVDDHVEVSMRGAHLGNGRFVDAFAVDGKVVANAAPRVEFRNGAPLLIFAKSDYFTSIPKALHLLVVPPGSAALDVHAVFSPSSQPTGESR